MTTKTWIIITLVLCGASAVSIYMFFPKTIKEEKIVYKDKLNIKDGRMDIKAGEFKLLPDGSFWATGDIGFKFGSYNSDTVLNSTKNETALKQSYLGLIANPLCPLTDNGIIFDTPFLFNTKAWVIVEQTDFKVLRGKVGIGLPI